MIRFTRHEPNEEGTHETITLVRLDSDGSLAVQIETGTPETWRKDPNDRTFVGLFDLDGEQIGNETWEVAEETAYEGKDASALGVPGAVLSESAARDLLIRSWETGTTVCENATYLYAAVGDDGVRPVVWGVGNSEWQARNDAERCMRDVSVDPASMVLRIVEIDQARYDSIVTGNVDASDL